MATPNGDSIASTEANARYRRLCEMTREMLYKMTSAENDRMRQIHLAAARGPEKNLAALFAMTTWVRSLNSCPQSLDEAGDD